MRRPNTEMLDRDAHALLRRSGAVFVAMGRRSRPHLALTAAASRALASTATNRRFENGQLACATARFRLRIHGRPPCISSMRTQRTRCAVRYRRPAMLQAVQAPLAPSLQPRPVVLCRPASLEGRTPGALIAPLARELAVLAAFRTRATTIIVGPPGFRQRCDPIRSPRSATCDADGISCGLMRCHCRKGMAASA